MAQIFFENLANSYPMVYCFWPFDPFFQVKNKLLARKIQSKKSNLVSISVASIVFGFSGNGYSSDVICIVKLVNSIVRSLSNWSIQLSDHCQINLIFFSLFEINDFGIDTSTDVEHSQITSNVAFSQINCTDMRSDIELTLELTDLTLI